MITLRSMKFLEFNGYFKKPGQEGLQGLHYFGGTSVDLLALSPRIFHKCLPRSGDVLKTVSR